MSRELTERQQKFLDALFADANGSIKDAKIIAGYSTSTNNQEIIQIISQSNNNRFGVFVASHIGIT